MPCEERKMPDGSTKIVCFPGPRSKTCAIHGNPATKLCDYPVGNLGETCDEPLCDKCAFHPLVNGLPMFGNDKDYCPEHAAAAVKDVQNDR
jgi:hypothetical protein